MEGVVIHHVWKAEEYCSNSSVQSNAASHILSHIQFKGSEKVVDIGCGDGKVTAKISKYVPSGSVLGIDISPEMIDFAKRTFSENENNNLTFLLQDAQFLDFNEEFDVVFSSFAIQWILDQNSFFGRVYRCLQPSGSFAATIPLGLSSSLERSINETISHPIWAAYFCNFQPSWCYSSETEYLEMLKANKLSPSLFSVTLHEVMFSSRNAFEKYVLQWFPYLQPLPEYLRSVFFKQIIDRYFELEPPQQNGEVRFIFPRLDIISTKSVY